ncbi:MAG: hypothetical protein HY316_07085 [Acidobacteria bacterium]|nr:hypothetical protein [Acidobacteriota bacterium]
MAHSILHKKSTMLALLVFISYGPARAQNFQWTRQFGSDRQDIGFAIAVHGSSVYLAGVTSGTLPGQTSSGGTFDAFVAKYDSLGTLVWLHQFGTAGDDFGDAVAADSTGVYVAGLTSGVFAGQISSGLDDAFVRKYDPGGTLIWTRQFGTTESDEAFGLAADQTGIYVVGSVEAALPGQAFLGSSDAFVRKYTADGNEVWTRQFGSPSRDRAAAVAVTGESVYVAGSTFGALPGQSNLGMDDFFVRKYDANGGEQWTRQFGSSSGDFAWSVAAVDASVYVGGYTRGALPGHSNAGIGQDPVLRKYDANGNEQWTRQFGSPGLDVIDGMAADPTGVYVVGRTDSTLPGQTGTGSRDAFARKYDVNGNDRWTRQFGFAFQDGAVTGHDGAFSVAADSSGVYVTGEISGAFPGETFAGGISDAYALKMNPGGPPFLPFNAIVGGASYVPSVTAGSIASAFGFSLAPQNAGGLLVHVGGIAAPVYAVTNSQINFQVPWELTGSSQNFLVVTVDGNTTSPVSIPVATFAPGIFSADASGTGQGAILIANTAFLAAPEGMFPGSRPVSRGDFISIYATGLGPVTNQPPTGVNASSNPASLTITLPTVTIGGVTLPAEFSGLAPDFFGLYQVNARVPQGISAGTAIPITVNIGGTSSNTVTIAVQ